MRLRERLSGIIRKVGFVIRLNVCSRQLNRCISRWIKAIHVILCISMHDDVFVLNRGINTFAVASLE